MVVNCTVTFTGGTTDDGSDDVFTHCKQLVDAEGCNRETRCHTTRQTSESRVRPTALQHPVVAVAVAAGKEWNIAPWCGSWTWPLHSLGSGSWTCPFSRLMTQPLTRSCRLRGHVKLEAEALQAKILGVEGRVRQMRQLRWAGARLLNDTLLSDCGRLFFFFLRTPVRAYRA